MSLRFALFVLVAASRAVAGDEDPAPPPGASWKGSVSLGAELDERGFPGAQEGSAEKADKPARFRIGFSASWSFSLHWERIESSGDAKPFDAKELSEDEAKILELTNRERKQQNLPPLKPDPVLMKLARTHAAAMARLDKVGHDVDGKTFAQRMEEAKYSASRAGENVAEGQRTPAEAMADWMQSPGHKSNILQADYTQVGVASAKSKSGKHYWTQIFAKPFPKPAPAPK